MALFSLTKLFFGKTERKPWDFEFRVRKQEEVKISEARMNDINETISLLGKLVEFHGFRRERNFIDHDGWPREAKITRQLYSEDGGLCVEENIFVEVYVELSGQNYDRVGRPEWSIDYERDEYEDEPLDAKRKQKTLEGVTVKKARDFFATVLNAEL